MKVLVKKVASRMNLKLAAVILFVLVGFGSISATAQPTIKFEPDKRGTITEKEVVKKLKAHFGEDTKGLKEKEFIAEFGAGTTEIGTKAFSDCNEMILTSLPVDLKSIGEFAFLFCESIELTSLPNKITNIPRMAFMGCKNIETMTLPTGLKSIDYDAFADCEYLETIIIPTGIININACSFAGCKNLKEITILATKPPVIPSREIGDIERVFEAECLPETCILYVPASAVNTYKNSDWNIIFNNKIKPIPKK